MINYLRISVTDRCNLKCVYCHPPQKIDYLNRADICSYEELLLVARVASGLGIEKIRLTGGELFLRKGIMDFIQQLMKIEEIKEIGLTTNGTQLLPYLKPLKDLGIKSLNISLDTLSEELFYQLTGSRLLDSVLKGIFGALDEGFRVKINTVVLRGRNDGEIVPMIKNFSKTSAEVRFIEFMPLCGSRWEKKYFFSFQEIKERISGSFQLVPLLSSGSAQEFFLSDGNGTAGKIGIIAPVTLPFCGSCSRLRLTANGELRPCLYSRSGIDLLPLLRSRRTLNEEEEAIRKAIRQAVGVKPSGWPEADKASDVYIGTVGG